MAIAKDATSSAHAQGASSLSWSHTCTGSDLLLLVHSGTNGTPVSTSGVTYNGVALTSRWSDSRSWTAASGWSLVAPATGANTVAITLSAAEDTEFGQAISYTGVDQTTPHGTAQVANGASTAPAVPTLTSATGEICVGFLMTSDAAITSGSGQTAEISDVNFASDSAQTDSEPGDTSVDITWTTSGGPWTCGGIPIKPASGGTTIAIGATSLNVTGLVEVLDTQLPINVGTLAVTGLVPSLVQNVVLPVGVGTFTVTGFVPLTDQTLVLTTGSIIAQGLAATLNTELLLEVGQLVVNGFEQSLQQSIILEISTGSFAFTGIAPSLETTVNLSSPTTVTVTGFAPDPTFGAQTVSIDAGSIVLTGFNPTAVVSGIGITPTEIVVSGIAVTLSTQLPIGGVNVLAQGFAPSLTTTTPISVGQLIITGLAPSLQESISNVAIGVGELIVSGYVQTLISGYPTIDISAGSLTVSGYVPAVDQLLLIRDTATRAGASYTSKRSDSTHTSKRTST